MIRLLAPALLLALSGCGQRAAQPERSAPADPAAALALAGPLLTDPDLATQSRRFAVLSDPGPLDASLPLDDFPPATVAAARAEAKRVVAGRPVRALPAAGCPDCAAATLAARAAALGAGCGRALEPGFGWALQLPAELPLYPRSHLREAAGAERGACRVRAASFTAPVGAAGALAFHAAVAAKAGYTLHRAERGKSRALIGRRVRDGARLAVIVRAGPAGTSVVDLLAAAGR